MRQLWFILPLPSPKQYLKHGRLWKIQTAGACAHNTGVMVFFADTSKAVPGKVAADLATFELASTVEI